MLVTGEKLKYIEAEDDDAGIFGDVNFEISSGNDDHLSFEILKINRKQSELRAIQQIEERTYKVKYIF